MQSSFADSRETAPPTCLALLLICMLSAADQTRNRIEAAVRISQSGVLTIDRPARELFRHYDAFCSNVTQDYYRNVVGRMINPSELQSVDQHIHVVMQT